MRTQHRQEDYFQERGEFKLELRGGPLEIALFVNGTPLIYDAADCAGSVGRFTTLLENARPDVAATIGAAATSGFAEVSPLSEQIAPMLQLLSSGNYALSLAPINESAQCYMGDDYLKGTHLGYYPYGDTYQFVDIYLGTQPESSLRDEVVNRYLDAIDGGARPALISLGAKNHVARFILDGHHKLMAYWCCGIAPVVLHIEAETMAPISVKLAEKLLENVPDYHKASYLKWKRKQWILRLRSFLSTL